MQSFSDVIKGLQYAVNSAQEMMKEQHLRMLGNYFDSEGDAATRKIKTRSGKVMNVPLVTLVPHNSLSIDEIEISFTAKITDIVKNQHDEDPDVDVDHLGLNMDIVSSSVPKKSMMNVTVRFKSTVQPEGFSRIIDEHNKLL
jgi:hypothetical protein